MMKDRNALAIDQAESRAAWDITAGLMRNVSQYLTALEGVDTRPVAVFDSGSSIDPFWNLADLKQAVITALQHAYAWRGVGMDLNITIVMGIVGFHSLLKTHCDAITAMVKNAEAAHRDLTAAEKADILAKLRGLESTLQSDKGKIESLRPRLTDFIQVITKDYPSFDKSGKKIDDAITNVQNKTVEIATRYLDNPPLMKMVTDLGAAIIKRLQAVSPAVHQLEGANDTAQKSTLQLIALWTTIATKYGSVIKELAAAEKMSDFDDLTDQMEIAVRSYDELSRYVQGTRIY